MLAETIMDMEREERSGPEGKHLHTGVYKWAYQKGSIYCGDQKIHVGHPRLRGPEGEIALSTYETLKQRGAFSEEILAGVSFIRAVSSTRTGISRNISPRSPGKRRTGGSWGH
jgi:hypothetical protein